MIQRGTAFARPALTRDHALSRRLTDKQSIAFAHHFGPFGLAGETCATLPPIGAWSEILDAARVPPNEDDLVDPLPF